jgi:hypothetical protein
MGTSSKPAPASLDDALDDSEEFALSAELLELPQPDRASAPDNTSAATAMKCFFVIFSFLLFPWGKDANP